MFNYRRTLMGMKDGQEWCTMLYEILYKDVNMSKYLVGGLRCVAVLNLEDEFTQVESLIIKEHPEITTQYTKSLTAGKFKFIKGNRFPLTNTELMNATANMDPVVKKNFFKNIVTSEPGLPYMFIHAYVSDIEREIIGNHTCSEVEHDILNKLPSYYRDKLCDYFDEEYSFSILHSERRAYAELVSKVYREKILKAVDEIILENRVIVIDANTVNVKILAGCTWWELLRNIQEDIGGANDDT